MHSNPNSPGSAHPVDHVNQMPGARTPAQTLGAPLLSQRTWTRGCERTSHRHAALPAGLPLCFTATKPRYYYILISGSRHVRTTRSYSSPLNSAQTLLKLFWTVARSAFLWALTPATKPEGRAAAPCPSSTQGWRLESQRRFAEGLTAVLTQRPPHPHLIRALLAAEPHPFWGPHSRGAARAPLFTPRAAPSHSPHVWRRSFGVPEEMSSELPFLTGRYPLASPQAPTAPSAISSSPYRCPPAQPPKQPHRAHSLPENQIPPEPSPPYVLTWYTSIQKKKKVIFAFCPFPVFPPDSPEPRTAPQPAPRSWGHAHLWDARTRREGWRRTRRVSQLRFCG